METLVEESEQLRVDVERFEKEATELRHSRESLEFELTASKRRIESLDKRVIKMEDEKGNRDNAYFEAKRTIARLTNDLGEVRLALMCAAAPIMR
jgi:septal ring factor EnvC (AmiA/AmiB activator)